MHHPNCDASSLRCFMTGHTSVASDLQLLVFYILKETRLSQHINAKGRETTKPLTLVTTQWLKRHRRANLEQKGRRHNTVPWQVCVTPVRQGNEKRRCSQRSGVCHWSSCQWSTSSQLQSESGVTTWRIGQPHQCQNVSFQLRYPSGEDSVKSKKRRHLVADKARYWE